VAASGGLTGAGGPGFDIVEVARNTIDRYRMLEGASGRALLVAVSGGPDSTCLLDVLARLAPAYDVKLEVAHVDHRLSGTSEEIAGAVASAAAKAGFHVHVGRAPDLSGPNLHARARAFRYAFFETVAAEIGAARIATGHTLDDRVETTLARLIHGAATEGLAGIPPAEGLRIRPLIGTRREETKTYCDARGLEFYDDPANEDERFERSVVRSTVVKAIEERWGPGAIRAIASSSERLREDAEFLSDLADTVYPRMTTTTEDGVRITKDLFLELGRALRRRVLERAIGRVRDRSGGIAAALDAAERAPSAGARFSVASGIEIRFGKDDIVVAKPGGTTDGAE
jgi:tRNA(Ile)-lysidine synthase